MITLQSFIAEQSQVQWMKAFKNRLQKHKDNKINLKQRENELVWADDPHGDDEIVKWNYDDAEQAVKTSKKILQILTKQIGSDPNAKKHMRDLVKKGRARKKAHLKNRDELAMRQRALKHGTSPSGKRNLLKAFIKTKG